MTNRSAKGGARSSLHYGGEGALIHPPHQGVCGRHGMEDQCVTLGDGHAGESPDTAKVDLEPQRHDGPCGGQGAHRARGGVRRVCGAVPGRSRGGDPMTNRSAKGGARSSLHYGGEGALIHPPHQGVCGRHGTEDQCVTLGDLGGSAGGTAATDPISESEVGRDARRGVGRPSSVRQAAHWSGGLKSLRPPDEGGRIQRRG